MGMLANIIVVMEMASQLETLAGKLPALRGILRTEESTKHALVLPFIKALGYDIHDPAEVTAELIADVATKKGEKVDYAILIGGRPVVLFECKALGAELGLEQASQLFRYFTTTIDARIGVLTDGCNYRFYSDLDRQNIMDPAPFLAFSLDGLSGSVLRSLTHLCKSRLNISQLISEGRGQRLDAALDRFVESELVNPSDELVRFFLKRFKTGHETSIARGSLAAKIKETLQSRVSAGAPAQFGNVAPVAGKPVPPDNVGQPTDHTSAFGRVTSRNPLPDLISRGLIRPPVKIYGSGRGYKLEGTVEPDGSVVVDGFIFKSLSGAAEKTLRRLSGRTHSINGLEFWGVRSDNGQLTRFIQLKDQLTLKSR